MSQSLVPVLCVSTNQSGSHRTLYAVGTRATDLTHDFNPDGSPTYQEGVFVEMVPPTHAAEVMAAASKGLHFSDTDAFDAWLSSE